MSAQSPLPLDLPETPEQIEAIQRDRKVAAVERARRSAFWRPKLEHINAAKLDDPEEWAKIPILDKEHLRAMSAEDFYTGFCDFEPTDICEYWRSGGSTGRPLFYPKTWEDIRYNMVGFTRTFECAGIAAGERAHISFPLGIHPAGQMWARAAHIKDIGVAWAGAGASLPSTQQLELIRMLKPTLWMGMSSYGLHLANMADSQNVDLAAGSVHTVMCTAEAVSAAKRAKMEREWGATLYDCFGMTEISMLGAEGPERDGFHVWSDLALFEVLDPETWKPVADDEPGRLVVTSLWSNNAAPFLRWDSGDIVVRKKPGAGQGPYSVFPVIRHAHRTAGFFKIRGVNINHQEFEDFMFEIPVVNDFKVEMTTAPGGLDEFCVSVELRAGSEASSAVEELTLRTKQVFEISPTIDVLETGSIAGAFESSVKAPRFVDNRE
ncbi:MAG: AMP-binding protein [Pseudomonadota bacterium]|nr:AMP-binding protein [Pseudomonadota bacterium]